MDARAVADLEARRPERGESPHRRDQSPSRQLLEGKTQTSDGGQASGNDKRPTAPILKSKPVLDAPAVQQRQIKDGSPEDHDSDAETVVLPGKDGYSPSKTRKVRQEDRAEAESDGLRGTNRLRPTDQPSEKIPTATAVELDNKKRGVLGSGDLLRHYTQTRKDGSSGLSSAPSSPPTKRQPQPDQMNQMSRQQLPGSLRDEVDRSSSAESDRESEKSSRKSLTKSMGRDKIRSTERSLSYKKKSSHPDSEEDMENVRPQRQRTISHEVTRLPKDGRTAAKASRESRTRSSSPQQRRQHRRSVSSQLPPASIADPVQKKRRPAALQYLDQPSEDSSASESPRPRSSKSRALAMSNNLESTQSPAKIGPHKKHLDAHGQTFLARACARSEYEGAKTRLRARPEDLNVADYAGNTPLQIAAINGCEDIVKLLIDAGCNLDCVNYDKDTPLLDAVDNGHLGVVKLLLDAGVNPRKANVNGEEPIDRVTDDTENAIEIRAALIEAKKRAGDKRRTSEDRGSHPDHDALDSNAPDSPRRSPTSAGLAGASRRSGTVRSTKTRNDLLYMPLDEKTLRQAAGRGDQETVARVLQVKDSLNDPESMVAAARGGHETVMELLLGLGEANPDPAPVSGLPSEFATPILAAIGQENMKVIQLLLQQHGFDPTRRYKGETYYEIARRRQGTNWTEEEDLLKNAYDEYKRSRREMGKSTKSPGRREEKRTKREDTKEDPKSHRRNLSSPPHDTDAKRRTTSKLHNPRETKSERNDASTDHGDESSSRRGTGRPKRDEKPTTGGSDHEETPDPVSRITKNKRSDFDAANASSEGESMKPRRKLVSKGELRGEREKHQRPSLASGTLGSSSPAEPRHEGTEKRSKHDKQSEKLKITSKDEARGRGISSGNNESSTKRQRTSISPDGSPDREQEDGEALAKRRRIDGQNRERSRKHRRSSGNQQSLSDLGGTSFEGKLAIDGKSAIDGKGDMQAVHQGVLHRLNPPTEGPRQSSPSERSVRVKSEDVDTAMLDTAPVRSSREVEARNGVPRSALGKVVSATQENEISTQEAERNYHDAVQLSVRKESQEAQKREEAEKLRKEQEEQKKKRDEEEAQRARLEAERKQREAEEAARLKDEEEKEKRRVAEETRQREEEEQRQREEAEQLRREQVAAAETAKKEREEEERKEKELREKLHREEMERKKAAREAELRRIHEEQERARLDKLPPLLRWLDQCPDAKQPAFVQVFDRIQGCRYDTIQPDKTGTAEGREQWALNADVALLLGEKDLELSRYTAWIRVPASPIAKLTLWRTEWSRYSLVGERFWSIGRQLPGHYGGEDPSIMSLQSKEKLKRASWKLFLDLDMFFVKVSDLMYTVPTVPHLRNVRISVEYRELMEDESQVKSWKATEKWKHDPGLGQTFFAPGPKHYVNGVMTSQDVPSSHQVSREPFPEKRAPRRGLAQVYPGDPEYTRLCIEQGLEHLLLQTAIPAILPNGIKEKSANMAIESVTEVLPLLNGVKDHSVTNGASVANGTHHPPEDFEVAGPLQDSLEL